MMTRLQKKCLVAVIGAHLLMVVAIFCSGFVRPKPQPPVNLQTIDVISAKLVDALVNSGQPDATPPPPTPPVSIPTPPQTQPIEPPKPQPPVEPPPKPVEPVKPVQPDEPVVTKPEIPVTPKPKPQKHEIRVDLTKKVTQNTRPDNSAAEAEKAAQEAKRLRDRQRAFERAAAAIKNGSSKSTKFTPLGDSQADVANYAAVVKSVYMQAWDPPSDATQNSATVIAKVTIASDGRILDAHITERSGDASVDRSVQKALDRVTRIEAFPEGSTDTERTYPIKFDADAKRNF